MENDYGVIEKKLIRADANGVYASTDAWYGPWDSVDAFYEYLGSILGKTVTDSDIPNATQIGVKREGGDMTLLRWVKPTDDSIPGYWKDCGSGRLIYIAGVVDNAAMQPRSNFDIEGDATNVYYIKQSGFLGRVLTRVGNAYLYSQKWKNCLEYGTLDANGNVIPFDGAIYVTSEGRMYLSTSADIQDLSGGGLGGLTESQLEALNSGIDSDMTDRLKELLAIGITAEEIAELRRLKAMNMVYDSTEDTLAMTDAENNGTRKEYYIGEAGEETDPTPVVVTYSTPTVTLSYGNSNNISGSGGTFAPSIIVSQKVMRDGVEASTNTYTTLKALNSALTAGDSVGFEYASDSVDDFDSLDPSNGTVIASANTSGDDLTVKIKMTVKLNGMTGAQTITVTQQSTEKMYITDISYSIENGDTTGVKLLVPELTASDNGHTTYAVDDYLALASDVREQLVLTTRSSLPAGVTFDGTTGVFTIDMDTYLGAIAVGGRIDFPQITVTQDSDSHKIDRQPINPFGAELGDGDKIARSSKNLRQSSDGTGLVYSSSGTEGIVFLSQEVSAGDTVLVGYDFSGRTNTSYPAYLGLLESTEPILYVSSNGNLSIPSAVKNSSSTTNMTNATSGGGSYRQFYTDNPKGGYAYKVKGTSGAKTYLTMIFRYRATSEPCECYFRALE